MDRPGAGTSGPDPDLPPQYDRQGPLQVTRGVEARVRSTSRSRRRLTEQRVRRSGQPDDPAPGHRLRRVRAPSAGSGYRDRVPDLDQDRLQPTLTVVDGAALHAFRERWIQAGGRPRWPGRRHFAARSRGLEANGAMYTPGFAHRPDGLDGGARYGVRTPDDRMRLPPAAISLRRVASAVRCSALVHPRRWPEDVRERAIFGLRPRLVTAERSRLLARRRRCRTGSWRAAHPARLGRQLLVLPQPRSQCRATSAFHWRVETMPDHGPGHLWNTRGAGKVPDIPWDPAWARPGR